MRATWAPRSALASRPPRPAAVPGTQHGVRRPGRPSQLAARGMRRGAFVEVVTYPAGGVTWKDGKMPSKMPKYAKYTLLIHLLVPIRV